MSVRGFLELVYPGATPRFAHLRAFIERIVNWAGGPVALVLQGPPGVGKTTAARAIAVARAMATIDPTYLGMGTERALRMVFQGAEIGWYRTVSLPGLTETLADSQLFGLRPKGATDVAPRIGVFEQAMTGARANAQEPHRRLLSEAREGRQMNLITGGVVLLDEIGDAPDWLQLKLLRLLNGEPVSRVHGEGDSDYEFTFRGIIVLATWRDLDSESRLRPDLHQRIMANRLLMPSLSEYPVDARTRLIQSIAERLLRGRQDLLAELEQLLPTNSDEVINASYRRALGSRQTLASEQVVALANCDWGRLGEFRGLLAAVQRVVAGMPVQKAITDLEEDLQATGSDNTGDDTDLDILVRYLSREDTLSRCWAHDRVSWAGRVNHRLAAGDTRVQGAIQHSGKARERIKKELENLQRSKVRE